MKRISLLVSLLLMILFISCNKNKKDSNLNFKKETPTENSVMSYGFTVNISSYGWLSFPTTNDFELAMDYLNTLDDAGLQNFETSIQDPSSPSYTSFVEITK